ncbi:MAG: phage integrase SAM-like domain-containing protein [Tannerellaceae bacterium]|nr:phage integrase SAM-like domain-containing protein [Tannerellaceae bacterium]
MDGEFVRDFDMFLKVERACLQNTVIRYMKCFKKIVNLAIATRRNIPKTLTTRIQLDTRMLQ